MSNGDNVIDINLHDYLVEEGILELFERELVHDNIETSTIGNLSSAFDWADSLSGPDFWVGHSENMDRCGLESFS